MILVMFGSIFSTLIVLEMAIILLMNSLSANLIKLINPCIDTLGSFDI